MNLNNSVDLVENVQFVTTKKKLVNKKYFKHWYLQRHLKSSRNIWLIINDIVP